MSGSVRRSLRSWRATFVAAAAGVPPHRYLGVGAALLAVVALVVLLPLPDAVELRDWATSVGPWFPLVFFAVHVVVTVFPIPRTAFTLAGGLLFGPLLGAAIVLTASTLSAVIALALIRAFGWQLTRLSAHRRVEALDAWMCHRGWRAVLSLRLVAPVPFALINYAAAASSVRALPYAVVTFVGLLPGTTALVILGDAITGDVDPLLIVCSAVIGAVGVTILGYEGVVHRRRRVAAQPGAGTPVALGAP